MNGPVGFHKGVPLKGTPKGTIKGLGFRVEGLKRYYRAPLVNPRTSKPIKDVGSRVVGFRVYIKKFRGVGFIGFKGLGV